MTQAELTDWSLSLWTFDQLCQVLSAAHRNGQWEKALQVHAELRTRIADGQYPQHQSGWKTHVGTYIKG